MNAPAHGKLVVNDALYPVSYGMSFSAIIKDNSMCMKLSLPTSYILSNLFGKKLLPGCHLHVVFAITPECCSERQASDNVRSQSSYAM